MILFFSLHQQWDDDENNDDENEIHLQVLRKSVESVGREKEKCICFVIHEKEKNKKKTSNYIQVNFVYQIINTNHNIFLNL